MELIQTVFDQLQADIQQKLKVVEKQMVFILSQNDRSSPSDDVLIIRRVMNSLNDRLDSFEARIQAMERAGTSMMPTPVAQVASGGLEGLLMKPITLPSPALSARSENHIVLPIFQRQIQIPEVEEEAEPDEEVLRGVVAEQTGGLDEEEQVEEEAEEEEEEAEEEEQVEEDAEEEEQVEEEGETIELEEFIWKGKTYFKTPENMVYRANEEGDVEDEPFAKYDPKTNTLKRI
jgi:hypothetical protein